MSSVATLQRFDWLKAGFTVANLAACTITFAAAVIGFSGIIGVHWAAGYTYNSLSTWFPASAAIVASVIFIGGSLAWIHSWVNGQGGVPLYWFESNPWVWKFPIFMAVPAILLFAGSWFDVNANSRLGTPSGYLRVMNDGRILPAGTVVAHNPARITSVIVALVQSSDIEVRIKKQSRYAVHMNVSASVALVDNLALRALLAKASTKVLGLGYDKRGRIEAQNKFFAAQLSRALSPSVSQLLTEIVAGKLPSDRDVLLRLGAIVDRNRKNYPPWVKEIRISNVNIKEVRIQR